MSMKNILPALIGAALLSDSPMSGTPEPRKYQSTLNGKQLKKRAKRNKQQKHSRKKNRK